MAKKKKTIKDIQRELEELEAEEQPDAPSFAGRLARLLFRPRLLLLGAAVVCAAAFYPQLRSLLPDLQRRREYRLTLDRIQVSPPPRWVAKDFVEKVAGQGGIGPHTTLLDDTLAERVAEAFEDHPWVARVVRVRPVRTANSAGLYVELEYRSPAAMVQVEEGFYPVDGQGVLLPPSDFSVSEARQFPVIENAASKPPGQPGTAWGDAAVKGAARLADELAPHWKSFGLASISVFGKPESSAATDDITYELRTSGASRVIWGRAPGSKHPGELTSRQKIGRLEKYLADFGSFDDSHGAYEIDIRHWREISRRPVSSAPHAEHR